MAMFKAGAGTILYFEDQSVIKGLQNNSGFMRIISQYGQNNTSAMHQYTLECVSCAQLISANLQHYNGVIENEKTSIATGNSLRRWYLVFAAPADEKPLNRLKNATKGLRKMIFHQRQ